MDMTECQKLAARFETKAAAGLVDVKFYVGGSEATSEQVCGEVNALYTAVEKGDLQALNFVDSRKK